MSLLPGGPARSRSREDGGLLLRLLPLLVVLAAGAVFAFVALRPRAASGAPLAVTVTVPPQAWLARRLGGGRVAVDVLLPPGADVHTYEPTPQQVERLGHARVIVAVGHPALPLEGQLLAAATAGGRRPMVVDMAVEARDLGAALPADDPHLWLSPTIMGATARRLTAALAATDPAGAAAYHRNLLGVLAEIEGLDSELRRDLAGLARRRFFTYHPSWGCFGADYGLEQVAIEADGKEPSARRLVELVAEARRAGTRAVFVQEGVADRPARVLAAEIGAVVVPLDALGEDWPANLRRAGASFREALDG